MSNKNALQGANVRTSSISLRTPATKQTQSTPGRMVNTQKSPPWACDKGAQKLAQNVFPPWRGDHVNSVPDLAASPPPHPEFIKTKMLLCCTGSGYWFRPHITSKILILCIILIYMQLPEGFGMYMKTAYWRIPSREVTKLIEYTIWIASSAPVCPLLHALKWQDPVAQKMDCAIDRINH